MGADPPPAPPVPTPLQFGDRNVRNNSYVLGGDIPDYAGGANALLCASDTTNPTTRHWYKPNGAPLPKELMYGDHGTYEQYTDGGVLLYRRGNLEKSITGVYYCKISDKSGNIHILYAGLYTANDNTSTTSGRANGKL